MPAAIILTEEEENKICELYKSGVSFRTIWKEYGYTNGITRKVLVKHGVTIRDKLEARAEVRERKKAEHKFVPREKKKNKTRGRSKQATNRLQYTRHKMRV